MVELHSDPITVDPVAEAEGRRNGSEAGLPPQPMPAPGVWFSLGLLGGLLLLAIPAVAQERGDDPDPYSMQGLETHEGQGTNLRQVAAGKRLVVVVMKSSECPICRGQLQRLGRLSDKLRTLDVTVVGLAHDGTAAAGRGPAGSFGGFPVVADRRLGVLRALRVWRPTWAHPTPSLLVFDKCGAERARLEGRGPGIRPEKALFAILADLAEKPCGARLVDVRGLRSPDGSGSGGT